MVVGMSTRVTTALILAIALGLALTFAIRAVARNKHRNSPESHNVSQTIRIRPQQPRQEEVEGRQEQNGAPRGDGAQFPQPGLEIAAGALDMVPTSRIPKQETKVPPSASWKYEAGFLTVFHAGATYELGFFKLHEQARNAALAFFAGRGIRL